MWLYPDSLEINLPNNLRVEKATKISENLRENLIKEIRNLSYVAIQIKSYQVETGFYRPAFGRGFGWQRRGRFVGQAKGEREEVQVETGSVSNAFTKYPNKEGCFEGCLAQL